MKYEIKHIHPSSVVFSVVPIILMILGFLGALLTFVIFPEYSSVQQSFMYKLVSIISFTLVYTISIELIMLICVFIYNLFSSFGIRGIKIDLDSEQS